MKNTKVEKINKLNKSLKHPEELSGLFLPKKHKKNFNFMIVAEIPSMNEPKNISLDENFNFSVTKRDDFFQKMLVKYGLAGSYVTDIVKKRDIAKQPTKKEIKKWLPFILKEIEIIEPKNIIVIGKRTYEHSFLPFIEPLVSKNIKIEYIFHYCSQVSRSKFEKRLKEIVEKFKK